MKLSIIIPQYKESEQVLSSALWSIANQKEIDLNDLEVIIVNDASDVVPSKEFLKKFPYKITLLRAEVNGGAGMARQLGTDKAKGKYILYLDADDCLISCIALRYIMNYKGKADIIKGKFFNEGLNKVDDGWTWFHGKFYKRDFLRQKNLRFPKDIRVNEDACFNAVARVLGKTEEIDEIITFWAKNPNSTTRSDNKFVVHCYDDFLKGKEWAFKRMLAENEIEELRWALADLFVYSYYYFMQIEYQDEAEAKERQEKIIAKIVKLFWKYFHTINERDWDMELQNVAEHFKGYVNYRVRETFDDFRARIYDYDI